MDGFDDERKQNTKIGVFNQFFETNQVSAFGTKTSSIDREAMKKLNDYMFYIMTVERSFFIKR